MQFFVGTSGYGYKEWKGSFYPEKLPQKQMLTYYGQRFNSVELNNTFRRMPTADSLQSLLDQVPKSFRFAVKAPQSITHFKRLKDAGSNVQELKDALQGLKKQAGPVLFQLPPNFKKDIERLDTFLKSIGKGISAAFEFRHESWYDDEVFKCLRKHACALCAADAEDTPKAQLVRTAKWGYVRLRRDGYTKKALTTWLKNIRTLDWKTVYVYFKHEETGMGPKLARMFLELTAE